MKDIFIYIKELLQYVGIIVLSIIAAVWLLLTEKKLI